MTTKPWPNRLKLMAQARDAGCVVANERGTTTIENGKITLHYSVDSDIKDAHNKSYTAAEAFDALGITCV
jgi:hypothetical protein